MKNELIDKIVSEWVIEKKVNAKSRRASKAGIRKDWEDLAILLDQLSLLVQRETDLGRTRREPEARICPHCGFMFIVSSRGRFHNHGSRSNPCLGSGMYIEPVS